MRTVDRVVPQPLGCREPPAWRGVGQPQAEIDAIARRRPNERELAARRDEGHVGLPRLHADVAG